jgi:GH35 family endo-1,4-beta-xylanase
MRRAIGWGFVTALAALPGQLACAIDGSSLALRSFGSASGVDWNLTENGYVGTYITLATPGNVTIELSAAGLNGGGADPRMNVVVGDQMAAFDVPGGFNSFQHTFLLPAGTHFVRTEYANDFVGSAAPAATRQLTVRSLNVAGATMVNSNTDENALAAADTYIQHGRRGAAHVQLYGAAPGAAVEVKLRQHAFNWGANVYGSGSTATKPLDIPQFTDFFKTHFNMVVPSRAGKWNNNEAVRDAVTVYNVPGDPTSGYLDRILKFAEDNNMGARMHNLIWGNDTASEEQPSYAVSSLTSGTASALGDLRSEISERIDYYLGDGANGWPELSQRYSEVDIYNESWHTGVNTPGSSVNYWDRYQASGINGIYEEAAQAAAAAGGWAKTFINEYNVLQNGNDDYGNWYRQHIETIQNADGVAGGQIGGVGMQLYPVSGLSPAYMQQVLQNVSVLGLPHSITEFGVQSSVADPAEAKEYVNESLRMAFGDPNMNTFMYWGFWANATSSLQSASTLANVDWSLTDIGKMYEDMLGIEDWDGNPDNGWTTNYSVADNTELHVGADGSIDFTGFYGVYDVTIGDMTYALDLTKGTVNYGLIVGPPSADFDLDGDVDGSDFLSWQRGFGTASNAAFAVGDADFDRDVDDADLTAWAAQVGSAATAGSVAVPEPSGWGASGGALAFATAASRRRRSLIAM